MNYNILGYGIYLAIILFVVLYVGKALFTNGRLFCIHAFNRDVRLADAINKMLLAGYYLINIGYSVFILIIREEIPDGKRLLEVLGFKLGAIVLALGIIHYLNVIIITGIGIRQKEKLNAYNINPKT
jgi:hypothetical protein